jgi:hypothetical protein
MRVDLSEQLQIQQQINKLIQDREALLKKQSKLITSQSKMSQKMCQALEKCHPERGVNEMRNSLDEAAESANKVNDEMEEMADSADEAAESAGGFGISLGGIATAGAGLLGIGSIFNKIGGAIEGVLGVAKSLIQGVFSIGKAILLLPFQILGNIIEMAGTGGGGNELREAYEEVREEWGDISKGEGKAIIDMMKEVKKESHDVAGTGVSMAQMFGTRIKGMAETTKFFNEMAKEMGPTFHGVKKEMGPVAGELLAMSKGLGLSTKSMASFVKNAKYLGKDLKKEIDEYIRTADTMAEVTGISSKTIGRLMGELTEDFTHFGHMSSKEIGSVVAHVTDLGVEVKVLGGVMDTFLKFEDAAEAAGKLAGAMGMQVDAYKLATTENPAEMIDELRNSFHATGKTLGDLGYRQKAFIKQTLNMDDATMRAVFSAENQGKSYEDLAAKAETSEDVMKDMRDIMKDLGKNIKRVFQQGQSVTGFFDAFKKGFSRGVRWSGPFMGMFRNIRKSLRKTIRFGQDIGKMFVDTFPGIADMLTGLKKIFDPTRFQIQLLDPLKKAFETFFSAVGKPGGSASVKTFLEKVSSTFMKWLGNGSSGGGQIWAGFQKFMGAMKNIFIGLMKVAAEGLTVGIRWMIKFIKDPTAGPFGELWDAMKDLFSAVWDEIGVELGPAFRELGAAFAELWAVALPMLQNAWDTYAPEIQKWFGEILTSLWDNKYVRYAVYALGAGIALMLAPILIPAIMGIAKMITGVIGMVGKMFDWAGKDKQGAGGGQSWGELGKTLAKQAASLVMVGLFLWAMTELVMIPLISAIDEAENLTPEKVLAFSLLMATMLAGGMAAALAAAWVGKFPLKETAIGMVLLGLFMLAIGGIGRAIVWMLSKVDESRLIATGKFMQGLGVMLGVMALVIPIAAATGLLATATFGIGAAIIAIGIAAIAGFIKVLVDELMPALESIKNVANKIGNPQKFKLVTEAISSMLQSIGGIVQGVAAMMRAAKPSRLDKGKNKTFVSNMEAVHTLIDNLMQNGLQPFINKMVELAKLPDISDKAVKVAGAIAGVMSAVASVVGSMGASTADATILQAAAENWGEDMEKMGDIVGEIKGASAHAITSVIAQMGLFIQQITSATAGKDFSKVGPFMESIGPIFQAMAGILTTMGKFAEPLMDDLEHYQKTRTGHRLQKAMTGEIQEEFEHLNVNSTFYMVLKTLRDAIIGMATSLQPMFNTISNSKVDPAVWKAGASIIGAVIGLISNITTMMGDSMDRAMGMTNKKWSRAENAETFQQTLDDQALFMYNTISAITDVAPMIAKVVGEMLALVSGSAFDNPDAVLKRLSVITNVMSIVNSIGKMFGDPKGPFAGQTHMDDAGGTMKPEYFISGPIADTMTAMENFGEIFAGKEGMIGKFLDSVKAIPYRKGDITKLKTRGKLFTAVAPVLEGVSSLVALKGSLGFFSKNKLKDVGAMLGDMVYFLFSEQHSGTAGGPIGELIKSVSDIDIPKGAKAQFENLGEMFGSLEVMMAALGKGTSYFSTTGVSTINEFNHMIINEAVMAMEQTADILNQMDTIFKADGQNGIEVAFGNFANAVAVGAEQKRLDIFKDGRFVVDLTVNIEMDQEKTTRWLIGDKNTTHNTRVARADGT